MKTTLMTILFAWTLIINMETGQKITITGLQTQERCEAIGYANSATKSNLSLRTFECVEEGKK